MREYDSFDLSIRHAGLDGHGSGYDEFAGRIANEVCSDQAVLFIK